MSGLKQFIIEVHRRSLWQVLMVYLGACWAVLKASDQVIDRYLLPEWVYPTEIIVLLVGLPIVLATAMVREESDKSSVVPSTSKPDRVAGGEAPPQPKADASVAQLADEERRHRARGAGSLARYPLGGGGALRQSGP